MTTPDPKAMEVAHPFIDHDHGCWINRGEDCNCGAEQARAKLAAAIEEYAREFAAVELDDAQLLPLPTKIAQAFAARAASLRRGKERG